MVGSLGAAIAVMGVTWIISVVIGDASIADISWGLAFVAIAWVACSTGDGGDRSVLLAALVTAWGIRLATYIAIRKDGEDRRYVAMRKKSSNFALESLWSVFGVQAAIAWTVSLPIQLAAIDSSPAELGVLAIAGAVVAAAGVAFEAIADAQLLAFIRDSGSSGKVMDRGLWRYSRHPNYFGEVCVWWGIWLIALETGSAWWSLIGPAMITFMLLRVSGVALTERTIADRRPGYAAYVRRTSAFVPRPPTSGS